MGSKIDYKINQKNKNMSFLKKWKDKLWKIGLLTFLLASISQVVFGDWAPPEPLPVRSFSFSEITVAIFFTVIIELVVALAFWGRKVKKLIIPIIIVNLISLPSLWSGLNFILGRVLGVSVDSVYYNVSIILGEGAVFVFEAFGIYFLSRKYVSLKESFVASIFMNFSSYWVGKVMNDEVANSISRWKIFPLSHSALYMYTKTTTILLAIFSSLFAVQLLSGELTIYLKKSFFKKAEISAKKALAIFLRAGVLVFTLFLGFYVLFGDYLDRNIIAFNAFLVLSLSFFIFFEAYFIYRYTGKKISFRKSLVLSVIQIALFSGIISLLILLLRRIRG